MQIPLDAHALLHHLTCREKWKVLCKFHHFESKFSPYLSFKMLLGLRNASKNLICNSCNSLYSGRFVSAHSRVSKLRVYVYARKKNESRSKKEEICK